MPFIHCGKKHFVGHVWNKRFRAQVIDEKELRRGEPRCRKSAFPLSHAAQHAVKQVVSRIFLHGIALGKRALANAVQQEGFAKTNIAHQQ